MLLYSVRNKFYKLNNKTHQLTFKIVKIWSDYEFLTSISLYT